MFRTYCVALTLRQLGKAVFVIDCVTRCVGIDFLNHTAANTLTEREKIR